MNTELILGLATIVIGALGAAGKYTFTFMTKQLADVRREFKDQIAKMEAERNLARDAVALKMTAIEQDLARCQASSAVEREKSTLKLAVIELLWHRIQEHLSADDPVLVRAKKLLDKVRVLGDTNGD